MVQTYVINLDHDTKKWEMIQKKFPWTLTRISAVDGSKEKRPFFINKLMYGCLQSHRKVWQQIVQNNQPALVLEDDCHPLPNFQENFVHVLKTLPTDYDVAVLGYIVSDVRGDYLLTSFNAPFMKRRCMRRINDEWFVPGYFIGSHCYLITPQGAKKLLEDPIIYHTDFIIGRNTNLQLYCVAEPIASQGNKGKLPYNPYTSWEWLLVEPIMGFGSGALRVIHFIPLVIGLFYVLFFSNSVFWKTCSKLVICLFFVHYVSTITHISHNQLHPFYPRTILKENRSKQLFWWNDFFSFMTTCVVLWIGFQNNILLPIVDILLLSIMVRVVIIHYFPMKDPSGICEEKSLSKYSLFEYCGSLRVSGHIFSSVLLAYLFPPIGIPVMAIQTMLILKSNSHYVGDVVAGIIVMMTTILLYEKKYKLSIRMNNI
jgi:GR25 family glycosyltransferase involved in LPS biosynthesis